MTWFEVEAHKINENRTNAKLLKEYRDKYLWFARSHWVPEDYRRQWFELATLTGV
jgi:hypothetical protein